MSRFVRMIQFLNRFRLVLIGAAVALGLGFYRPAGEEANRKDEVILNLIYQVLNTSHFSPQQMDDDFSEMVFENFLQNVDYSKRFLLAEDRAKLAKHKKDIDDQIRQGKLDFFDATYALYGQRLAEAKDYYRSILDQPFDFDIKESYESKEEELPWAASPQELRERWRLYLKYRTLVRLEEKLTDQENASDSTEQRSFADLEQEAREKVREIHDQWFENLEDMERIDWVAAYMNAITNLYDPHTQYFPPEDKEDFEINMTGQLEGIGAQLQQDGDYIKISKIITGSACWKQGDLEVGDRIIQVREGDPERSGEVVDMVGMKVRKAVNYIRGPKGTEVILTVRKVDGSKMEIPIVRDVVELESTFAKSAVLGSGDQKVGYIRLPKFYVNFYGEENHDCAEDVKAELEKLKSEGVNGVILDLRNNGGGSLQGVIDIVGLFIDKGPVVQVKAPGRKPKVLKDTDSELVYDGPLVVMVNRFSASASEIFAAAIQDYQRGIIVGSASTFGKGTVQNIVDMDRAVSLAYNDVKPLGALKLTIQKYYRINGGTPQLKGVQPDIVLPDNYRHIPFGEKEQDHALPYDEIEAANYNLWPYALKDLRKLQKQSAQRVGNNKKFALIEDYAEWIKEERENSAVNLQWDAYRQERAEYRDISALYKGMNRSEDSLQVSPNTADLGKIEASEEEREKAEKWHNGLKRDLVLQETFAISQDLYARYPKPRS